MQNVALDQRLVFDVGAEHVPETDWRPGTPQEPEAVTPISGPSASTTLLSLQILSPRAVPSLPGSFRSQAKGQQLEAAGWAEEEGTGTQKGFLEEIAFALRSQEKSRCWKRSEGSAWRPRGQCDHQDKNRLAGGLPTAHPTAGPYTPLRER